MNAQAVYHTIKSNYSFPVSNDELVIRLRTAKGDAAQVELIYSMKYDWTLTQSRMPMEKRFSDDLYDYFIVRTKLEDTRLAYIFLIHTETEGDFYFSENGLTREYDFALGYFNFFQCPYINPADVHREVSWARDAVVYQIFVERFFIGEQEKKEYINLRWGEVPDPKSFAGGDLEGIRQKLDYLEELGINTLYLTPIFESCSNHKYDIRDYFKVDPMFGGNEAFARLAKEAHDRGMRIILDAVFNHCSEENPIWQDVLKNGKRSPYHDWFFIRGDRPDAQKDNYEYFAGCPYMPKINTNCLEAQAYLISVGKHWIERYDIDGWRLDVADEVSDAFWRKFREAIKTVKADAVLVGENWHDAYPWLRGDEYDGIMNYSLTKACLDYLVYDVFDAQAMADRLSHILMRNTDQVNRMMLNLLDSHDTERFLTLAKKRGKGTETLLCALAILFFSLGMPCLYYGTEIGMEGGYDPDCRRTFDWDRAHWDMRCYHTVKRLIAVRKKLVCQEISYSARNGMLVIERGRYLLAVNDRPQTAALEIGGKTHTVNACDFIIVDQNNGGEL